MSLLNYLKYLSRISFMMTADLRDLKYLINFNFTK